MNKLDELSVFFPFYNEEKNIKSVVTKALKIIPKYAEKYEILLINDGSTDKTEKIGLKLDEENKNVILISQKNKGYGGALKTGFKNAKYEWVFYSDGDEQFNLDELKNFIEHTEDYDLVIGYRKKRAEGLTRDLITFGLKVWNKLFFGFPLFIKDIDCAFKLINKKVIKKVTPLVVDGGMISTEFLLKAINNNFKIKQVGATHLERKYGKSSGDSFGVISKAIKETAVLLNVFKERKDLLKILGASVLVFIALLPVSNSINFLQNDDYTHFRLIQNFLDGDFSLDPYIGSTFYLQGLISAIFAFIFGISKLPVLTLLVSVGAFYVFVRLTKSLLVGLLFFFNPLFLYSIWGIMTENYFLFFFLLSVYFIKKNNFGLANIFIFSSYLIRQFAFVTSLAFAVYLFINKKFRQGLIQLSLFAGLLIFHFKVFPLTPQMYDANLKVSNLLNFERSYSLLYLLAIYLGIFALPLIINAVLSSKKRVLLLLLAIPLFFLLRSNFEPKEILFTERFRNGRVIERNVKVEFPYLDNVFARRGFLEENLGGGNKYHYKGYFDLFIILDILGKIAIPLLILTTLLNYKKMKEFSFVYIAVFLGLLLVSPRIFDRYLITLVPMLFLFLMYKADKLRNLVVLLFVVFWLFLGYQYSADFILVNKYVWNRAEQLEVSKEKINVNHSWRSLYPVENRGWDYFFEYPESKRLDSELFEIIEEKEINFPFSLYVNPKVLLFERVHSLD